MLCGQLELVLKHSEIELAVVSAVVFEDSPKLAVNLPLVLFTKDDQG